MSSVVEACGSRIASACSSDSATSCCMVARSSLLRLRLRRIFGLGLETCVPQKVCKQRPQAICIPQVFGVLTEACLASSHFLHTSSQCEAAQGKEPVKTGKRWTQPQHLRKVSLLAARHFLHTRFPTSSEEWGSNEWSTMSSKHFKTAHTKTNRIRHEQCFPSGLCLSHRFKKLPLRLLAAHISWSRLTNNLLKTFKDTVSAVQEHRPQEDRRKVGQKNRAGTRTLSIFTFGSRCARWQNSQFSPCRQLR